MGSSGWRHVPRCFASREGPGGPYGSEELFYLRGLGSMGDGRLQPAPADVATDRFVVASDHTNPETGERRLLINDTHRYGMGSSFYACLSVTEEEGMQLRNLLEWHLK